MVALESNLRSALEKAVLAAREAAEAAARVALTTLAVERADAFPNQAAEQRQLRNALRARARQLGSGSLEKGLTGLIEEVAYEQWHRMLFARFLAENSLLIHPAGGAVTLEECAELASSEGEPDGWQLSARYASTMLPGIFRPDDPSHQVRFAREGRAALESILAGLPVAVFTSQDGLGWVYQFWQSKRKKEVSSSGQKIEKLDLAAYSELFTEHYIVLFLLENSLGAWWAARHPNSPLIKEFSYLRRREDGAPAAGSFPGWPSRAAELTIMDPCCGSGHFLVAAFDLLRRMRMEEENLSEAEGADAVLRDNLFGLELDPRCLQIAAFALALAAWKACGYRPLPTLNLACSGIPVSGQLEEWTKLAGADPDLRHTLERLFQLFKDAPDLGSLINPSDVPIRERMFAPDFAKVQPLLERALAKERKADPAATVFGEAAQGTTRAAELLSRQYTLVATNVPYLATRKQGATLKAFLQVRHSDAKADLATAFLQRCREFTAHGGTYALVTPHNWLFLGSYRKLRESQLKEQGCNVVARLGPGAFETISGEIVNVALNITTNRWPADGCTLVGIDASVHRSASQKAALLRERPLQIAEQAAQLRNPDARITLEGENTIQLLASYASGLAGIMNGDSPRFQRQFWELSSRGPEWVFQQTTVDQTLHFGGRELIILYDRKNGHLRESAEVRRGQLHDSDRRGSQAWGKQGVAVSSMGSLPVSLYDGDLFDNNTAVILPKDPGHLAAIWAFCSSPEFSTAVRRIDSALKVTNASLVKVPFDLDRWQKVVDELYPSGLPEPYSNDPTQWLFKGDPADSSEPLQVAVARLLGYRWPQQEPDWLDRLGDTDGIVALVAVAGEEPAEPRLREVLAESYGATWSPKLLASLLGKAGYGAKGLETWLRDGFFEQHCQLFHQRPFIWQIWDGTRDGFSALVNYHKLGSAHLDRLIYTYLGEWIQKQRVARDAGAPGAEARLVAALRLQDKLKAIQPGEPPHDIYVRSKALHEQPIGWEPDLNDGVRLNIRPFVLARLNDDDPRSAGVLRSRVNVNWNKDRGSNLDGSERINHRHLTVAEKTAARRAMR